MSNTEEWRPVIGYEGYYIVSNTGRVKSVERTVPRGKFGVRYKSKEKTQTLTNYGYYTVRLCKNCICTNYFVHRLLALAFLPNPDNLPFINHIDNNQKNNHITNLEWCTPKQNMEHAARQFRMNQGEKQRNAKLKEWQVLEIRKSTGKQTDVALALKFSVDPKTIGLVRRGLSWKYLLAINELEQEQ